jgi:hypothetical protein
MVISQGAGSWAWKSNIGGGMWWIEDKREANGRGEDGGIELRLSRAARIMNWVVLGYFMARYHTEY